MAFNKALRVFHEEAYERGVAIGRANIRDDTVTFRYKDEMRTFRTVEVMDKAARNGTFYELPLELFRKMKNGRL